MSQGIASHTSGYRPPTGRGSRGLLRSAGSLMASAALACLLPAAAHAQASRTWVSGVGDDANPCSRTAPCKTFAGAISKTAAGGEIDALDPGGFGAVTITKAITIDGGAGLSSVLVSGTNGIVINAGPSDVITIRNLSINGIGTGINGIRFLSGRVLHVENSTIFGFTNNGIDVNMTAFATMRLENVTINDCGGAGVSIVNSSSVVAAEIDHVRIWSCGVGVDAQNGARVTLRFSEVSMHATAAARLASNSEIDIDSTTMNYNTTAVSNTSGGVARITNNIIMNNFTGLLPGGGSIVSGGDNSVVGNVVDGLPTSTLTKR